MDPVVPWGYGGYDDMDVRCARPDAYRRRAPSADLVDIRRSVRSRETSWITMARWVDWGWRECNYASQTTRPRTENTIDWTMSRFSSMDSYFVRRDERLAIIIMKSRECDRNQVDEPPKTASSAVCAGPNTYQVCLQPSA